ncbi:hypothetical protein C8R44DRAFT_880526 [Mycena epipterygia]|nr:hypothetical protein C8R44DRAFT_880526 [Mycena epipterygia]
MLSATFPPALLSLVVLAPGEFYQGFGHHFLPLLARLMTRSCGAPLVHAQDLPRTMVPSVCDCDPAVCNPLLVARDTQVVAMIRVS